jgi:hypothetical protein
MPDHLADLNWKPVLLVKVTREPFTGARCGLHVSRMHLALHPAGVICAAWDLPLRQRRFPHVRLMGWTPSPEMPFSLPVHFEGAGDARVSAIIPVGTWVLPYDEEQYRLYSRLQRMWHSLTAHIDSAPHSPYTLGFIRSLITSATHSPSPN